MEMFYAEVREFFLTTKLDELSDTTSRDTPIGRDHDHER